MFIASIAVAAVILVQQPAAPTAASELSVISARVGTCAADFTVRGADGMPVYAATIHVRIRYGFMSLKRMDLEVGTNSDGKARIEGLPARAKPLAYDISKAGKRAVVEQDLSRTCSASYSISLE